MDLEMAGSRRSVLLLAVTLMAEPAHAQVTTADYARAERFLGWNASNLIAGAEVDPAWVDGDRFLYRSRRFGTSTFMLVDPAAGTVRPAFDHARLAAALSLAADTSYEASTLPFRDVELLDAGRAVRVEVSDSGAWTCDLATYACRGPDPVAGSTGEVRSPDGRWVAFERDENLWVRDTGTGAERQLTDDGIPDYGYAVHPDRDPVTAARSRSKPPPPLLWSPDSRRILTHRLDERDIARTHLFEVSEFRPVHYSFHYAVPGDSVVPTHELVVVDVASGEKVAVAGGEKMVHMTCCDIANGRTWIVPRWSDDGSQVFFTRHGRGYRDVELRVADAGTGQARTVLREESDTYVELTLTFGNVPNWRILDGGRQVLWFSERDGWGHLYLVDVASGRVLRRLTEGAWAVLDVLRVDEGAGWLYFTAVGREPGRDPYFTHLYRARLDGSAVELLTPENANHEVVLSPSGRFFVDRVSRRDTVPVAVLRRSDGTRVMTVEEGDVSPLLEAGWVWPRRFVAKARDGVTDVHGYLYVPSGLDPARRYPVVVYHYPGPQVGTVGTRGFTVSPPGESQALAELGFVVVTLDAMGSPYRSKAFHDTWYGNMGDHGLPDVVTALHQLAANRPWMDMDRVGIWGHSGGGFAAVRAMFQYPDVFKVGVSEAGNHDNRGYGYYWGEKYQGLLESRPGGDNFLTQANPPLADRLVGDLLLMYGTLDDRVPPNLTLLLIDELIDANLDFDLIVLPNRNHGFAAEPYVIRRRWDYLVEHLKGEEPPARYRIRPPG